MIKNKNKISWLFLSTFGWLIVLCFQFLTGVFGASDVHAATSDVAKWYASEQTVEAGTIVSIDRQDAQNISIASKTKSTTLLGVTVPENDAAISITEAGVDKKVQVAIAGRAQVKVDKSNGPISRGDLVGLSATDGVGAKAEDGQPVVGIAETSFGEEGDAKSSDSGEIAIIVSVGIAPSASRSIGATSTTWVRSIAGRDVSALQVFFVFFIAAVGIIAITVLTYGSVRNGIVATGRNPLAKSAILRALSQTMIMVSLVAISCFSLMYFMLRL